MCSPLATPNPSDEHVLFSFVAPKALLLKISTSVAQLSEMARALLDARSSRAMVEMCATDPVLI
jgi:hypothetical protein